MINLVKEVARKEIALYRNRIIVAPSATVNKIIKVMIKIPNLLNHHWENFWVKSVSKLEMIKREMF